jgi:hypothetical protein
VGVHGDQSLWVCLCRLWANWRAALVIVKPETVIAWHRKGFSLYWTWKSRPGQPGRAQVASEVRELIRKMSKEWKKLGCLLISKLGVGTRTCVATFVCNLFPGGTFENYLLIPR